MSRGERHFQDRTIVGRRCAVEVFERAITNLCDSSTVAILGRYKKIHQAIERGFILMPTRFKHTVRKQIQFSRKTQRHLHRRILGVGKAANGRTACR